MLASKVKIIPVSGEHVTYVAENMRQADVREVYESTRRQPLEALHNSVQRSERTATVMYGDVPAAIIGVGRLSLLSSVGVPWMLGTDTIRTKAKVLLPFGEPVVRKMGQGFTVLRNAVHDDNKAAIRWLKYMGFTMGEPVPAGWRGANFRVFEMEEGQYTCAK